MRNISNITSREFIIIILNIYDVYTYDDDNKD